MLVGPFESRFDKDNQEGSVEYYPPSSLRSMLRVCFRCIVQQHPEEMIKHSFQVGYRSPASLPKYVTEAGEWLGRRVVVQRTVGVCSEHQIRLAFCLGVGFRATTVVETQCS